VFKCSSVQGDTWRFFIVGAFLLAPRSVLYVGLPLFLFAVFKSSVDGVAKWRFGAGETPVVAFILGFLPLSGIKSGNLRITAIVSPNALRSGGHIIMLFLSAQQKKLHTNEHKKL
jgi:hypothetical protein